MSNPDVYTVAELCARWKVKRQYVWSLINSGALPCMRLSKRVVRIPWQSVDEYEQTAAQGSTPRPQSDRPQGTSTASSGPKKADRSAAQRERLMQPSRSASLRNG